MEAPSIFGLTSTFGGVTSPKLSTKIGFVSQPDHHLHFQP